MSDHPIVSETPGIPTGGTPLVSGTRKIESSIGFRKYMDDIRSRYSTSTSVRPMLPPPENTIPELDEEEEKDPRAAIQSAARATVRAFDEAHGIDLLSPSTISVRVVVVPMETEYTFEEWIGEPVFYESEELTMTPEDGHVAGDDVAYSIACTMGFNSGANIFPPRGIVKIFLKQGRASLPVMVGRYNLHAKWDDEDLRFCDIDDYRAHMESKTKQTKRRMDDDDDDCKDAASEKKRERTSNVSPAIKDAMGAVIRNATRNSIDSTKEDAGDREDMGRQAIVRSLYGDGCGTFKVFDDMRDINGGRIIMEGDPEVVKLRAWVRPFSEYQHQLAAIAASHDMPRAMREIGFQNIPETDIEEALRLLSVDSGAAAGAEGATESAASQSPA